MTQIKLESSHAVQSPQKQFLFLLILPLISCTLSSVVGIIIGQIGNLLYKAMGETASCLALPGFCGLFIATFGFSFLINKLLRKWVK
jgi:hypothetical protein